METARFTDWNSFLGTLFLEASKRYLFGLIKFTHEFLVFAVEDQGKVHEYAYRISPKKAEIYFSRFRQWREDVYRRHTATLSPSERDSLDAGSHPSLSHSRQVEARAYADDLMADLRRRGVDFVNEVRIGLYHGDRLILTLMVDAGVEEQVVLSSLPCYYRGFEVRWHRAKQQSEAMDVNLPLAPQPRIRFTSITRRHHIERCLDECYTAIGLTALMLLLSQCADVSDFRTNRFRPSPRVAEILSWPEEGGSVYYQARRSDGFYYRATLAKAAKGEATALSKLFAYTRTNHLTGEGAESHIDVLGELLKQWGDHDYGRILQLESPAVIRGVALSLTEYWGPASWPKDRYPMTENLCARITIAEQTTDGKTPDASHPSH
ncbi:MAG: hypothetical protein NTW21_43210 [Verrucomicrobia bacterium]|nr:hypothetical protein [Verrucomicrobiota bacterium]